MKITAPLRALLISALLFGYLASCTSDKAVQAEELSVAFWNVENLFDEYRNALTKNEELLRSDQVSLKMKNDARVINQLDADIIGLAEVENLDLVRRLVDGYLSQRGYKHIALIEGKDTRGIDVALISRHPFLATTIDIPGFSRDILAARFSMKGQPFYVVVNHWKSRLQGGEKVRIRSAKVAADYVKKTVRQYEGKSVPVILLGDFNDTPADQSLKYLEQQGLTNTMLSISKAKRWTLGYYNRDSKKMELMCFDQIIINPEAKSGTIIRWKKTSVVRPSYMISRRKISGVNHALPLDDYKDRIGYSDHFPVIATFELMGK